MLIHALKRLLEVEGGNGLLGFPAVALHEGKETIIYKSY
jgi:hypothetical protein